ncbi:uncharacterized protein [Watersipora subatra]|uniref:uncharacterized protein n=1 Tax=Watersipora subatra TaxID=2589382 RepID=UPI00355C9745
MKLVLYFLYFLALCHSQELDTTTCVHCLDPIWRRSVDTYENAADRCAAISLESVMACVDVCDATPSGKPVSYRIRQLTQISDIFNALSANSCSQQSSSGSKCAAMMDCVLSLSNYEHEGQTSHAPYSTVFDYNCSVEVKAKAISCLHQPISDCVTADRLEKLSSLLLFGVEAACDEPRRCVKYGNIFEIKPGTECTEYYQEAAAYGPSIGQAQQTLTGEGFNPEICNFDFLHNFECPPDPEFLPIYTEVLPAKPTPLPERVSYPAVTVNTSLPCEQCLHPIWFRAVTTNGSHLCEESFQSLIYECLANCDCCPGCDSCLGRYEHYRTEVLVKLADINKALAMNQCTGNPSCTAASYECTERVARFYPISAPFTTVNTFSCNNEDLANAVSCFQQTCEPAVASILSNALVDGYDPICLSNLRCLTYGSIYEYVPQYEIDVETDANPVPCAYYKQAPVHGWSPPTGILRVSENYLFNTEGCWPDFPRNVECPDEIASTDPMQMTL